MTPLGRYVLQRVSAALMLPLIVAHIGLIYVANAQGLSAAAILARTRGSLLWALFYVAFVLLASVHAAIGVRAVLAETTRLDEPGLDSAMLLFGIVLAALGLRAVVAVVVVP